MKRYVEVVKGYIDIMKGYIPLVKAIVAGFAMFVAVTTLIFTLPWFLYSLDSTPEAEVPKAYLDYFIGVLFFLFGIIGAIGVFKGWPYSFIAVLLFLCPVIYMYFFVL